MRLRLALVLLAALVRPSHATDLGQVDRALGLLQLQVDDLKMALYRVVNLTDTAGAQCDGATDMGPNLAQALKAVGGTGPGGAGALQPGGGGTIFVPSGNLKCRAAGKPFACCSGFQLGTCLCGIASPGVTMTGANYVLTGDGEGSGFIALGTGFTMFTVQANATRITNMKLQGQGPPLDGSTIGILYTGDGLSTGQKNTLDHVTMLRWPFLAVNTSGGDHLHIGPDNHFQDGQGGAIVLDPTLTRSSVKLNMFRDNIQGASANTADLSVSGSNIQVEANDFYFSGPAGTANGRSSIRVVGPSARNVKLLGNSSHQAAGACIIVDSTGAAGNAMSGLAIQGGILSNCGQGTMTPGDAIQFITGGSALNDWSIGGGLVIESPRLNGIELSGNPVGKIDDVTIASAGNFGILNGNPQGSAVITLGTMSWRNNTAGNLDDASNIVGSFSLIAKTVAGAQTANVATEQFLQTFTMPDIPPVGRVIRLLTEGGWQANLGTDTFTHRVYFGPSGSETKVCDSAALQATSAGNFGAYGMVAKLTIRAMGGSPRGTTATVVANCRQVMADGAATPAEARTRGQSSAAVFTINLSAAGARLRTSVQDAPGNNANQLLVDQQTQVEINAF